MGGKGLEGLNEQAVDKSFKCSATTNKQPARRTRSALRRITAVRGMVGLEHRKGRPSLRPTVPLHRLTCSLHDSFCQQEAAVSLPWVL